MDLSSISGISMVEEPSPYAEKASQEVDRDAFIKMFLAQMKHQDPLNPMDGSEFAAQIAQFSSLEQLYNVNESLESMVAGQEDQGRFQTLSLIGKVVLAEGNELTLEAEGTVQGGLELDQTATCSVLIYTEDGLPVRSLNLGQLGAGRHEFEWDGETAAGDRMPEGAYSFKVVALDTNGDSVEATPHMLGTVDRISLAGGASTLYVGQTPLDFESVLDIRNSTTGEAVETAAGEATEENY